MNQLLYIKKNFIQALFFKNLCKPCSRAKNRPSVPLSSRLLPNRGNGLEIIDFLPTPNFAKTLKFVVFMHFALAENYPAA